MKGSKTDFKPTSGTCRENSNREGYCAYWAAEGLCRTRRHRAWMRRHCGRACCGQWEGPREY